MLHEAYSHAGLTVEVVSGQFGRRTGVVKGYESSPNQWWRLVRLDATPSERATTVSIAVDNLRQRAPETKAKTRRATTTREEHISDPHIGPRHEEARTTDPATSHIAAKMPFKRQSQRHKLLARYAVAQSGGVDGLTDEEVAEEAGITRGCPWKRSSELREAGLIEPTGKTRLSTMGAPQQVCRITEKGRSALGLLDSE